ncbi:Mitochondrial inner membrane protease subunit 1 [Portunus trituberculatus]|uniref:Mitochondrial inner membrane protease subunit 1 n=1 Tax=Portunus trituberculatus TaxID=210409 RepID=A0A5B7H214_PORTR|nr:Mitochondrial inner membrane protease subunit 1 [Portunus trituberculatus]
MTLLNRCGTAEPCVLWGPRDLHAHGFESCPQSECRLGLLSRGNGFLVPKGHVWLEGDNHSNSTDSRNFGSVPAGLIRGRAVFRIWPLSDLGSLDSSFSSSSSAQKWEVDR